MKTEKTYLITFSPTGTSFKTGQAILKGIGLETKTIDLTHAETGHVDIPSDAIAVFSFPVYGGHIAPAALKRLKNVSSSGASAVAVAVYGNRDYESALCELGDMLRAQGFRVIAGATFVGEHSYCSEDFPIAPGRPDADDLRQAEEFGRAIRRKTDSTDCKEVELKDIRRPKSGLWNKLCFIAGVIKIRRSKKPRQMAPETNGSKCTKCGLCVKVCPTGAINEDISTTAEKCIRCCACVKRCPRKARTFYTPFAPLLARHFNGHKENMTIL